MNLLVGEIQEKINYAFRIKMCSSFKVFDGFVSITCSAPMANRS